MNDLCLSGFTVSSVVGCNKSGEASVDIQAPRNVVRVSMFYTYHLRASCRRSACEIYEGKWFFLESCHLREPLVEGRLSPEGIRVSGLAVRKEEASL